MLPPLDTSWVKWTNLQQEVTRQPEGAWQGVAPVGGPGLAALVGEVGGAEAETSGLEQSEDQQQHGHHCTGSCL